MKLDKGHIMQYIGTHSLPIIDMWCKHTTAVELKHFISGLYFTVCGYFEDHENHNLQYTENVDSQNEQGVLYIPIILKEVKRTIPNPFHSYQ